MGVENERISSGILTSKSKEQEQRTSLVGQCNVKTSNAESVSSISAWRAKTPHAAWYSQKKEDELKSKNRDSRG